MCGRIVLSHRPQEYAELFGIETALQSVPRYNIAPSADIYCCFIGPDGKKELSLMHWGLVPHWSKGHDPKFSLFNARAESVDSKPAYRDSFKNKRCLIPVDGFYEWEKVEEGKQPHYIFQNFSKPLVLAGLWDRWIDDTMTSLYSCSIITTEANDFMSSIHHRMPVILKENQYDTWLDPSFNNSDELLSMLKPYEGNDLSSYRVDKRVGNTRFDDESCKQPL